MSWTVDQERAVWFARRSSAGAVIAATLPKEKLLAYFLGRKEAEAVIDPQRIRYEVLEPAES